MIKPNVFIASSEKSVNVAKAIASGLERDAEVTVWKGWFRLNDGFLERLVASAGRFDYAIIVWAADDVTESKGVSEVSPRDNVIFECGLFIGALGRDHVFIVHDCSVKTKIPSDFSGIVLGEYDGKLIESSPQATVESVCKNIRDAIARPSVDGLEGLKGIWRQKYTQSAVINPKTVERSIEVNVFADTVSLVRHEGNCGDVAFEARGKFDNNKIRGEWHHDRGGAYNHGAFLLVLNVSGDVMYGYIGEYGSEGVAVFEGWVLAKDEGDSADLVANSLAWGEKTLREHTVGFGSMQQGMVDFCRLEATVAEFLSFSRKVITEPAVGARKNEESDGMGGSLVRQLARG